MHKIMNPYNFISFGEEINSNRKSREEGYRDSSRLLSGWLDVELIPSTPLIIPDGAHPLYIDPKTRKVETKLDDYKKKNCHKKYDFMWRYDENGQKQYYIPGSSLRGMIRSVYEAATDSCVPFLLADNKPISQRVPLYAALKHRGLLTFEYNQERKSKVWVLYSVSTETEAVTIKEEKRPVFNKYGKPLTDHNGREKTESIFHFVRSNGSEIIDSTGTNIPGKGILQYNVPVDIRREYHIAYLHQKEVVHIWDAGDDEAYRLLNSVLMRDNKKGNQTNRNEKPASDLKKALDDARNGKGNLVPVYYFTVIRKHEDGIDEELVYLSNSSAGRIAQKRKWADIMTEHGPCVGEKLCPACLLFGSKGRKYGLKSKIRVTDALPKKKILTEQDFSESLLDILGEPRTSAFEFYLKRPEGASYWNFDFYGVNEEDNKGVNHTKYYDLPSAMPRGRKWYWHGKPRVASQMTKLNTTMKAVKEGVAFRLKVYFDEVTRAQLDSLIWTLTLGENTANSCYQHKLGHAKPLGYGSVKLIVTGEHIRTIENDENGFKVDLKQNPVADRPRVGVDLDKQYVKELLKMSDIRVAKDIPVGYPTGEDHKIFSWFSENRVNAKTVETLPNPLDGDVSLKSSFINMRKGPGNKEIFEVGKIVDATISGIAEKDHKQFGVFIRLSNGGSGLLHKNNMAMEMPCYSERKRLKVKITEIKENGKYAVTDIL